MQTLQDIKFTTSESTSKFIKGKVCYQGQVRHNQTLDVDAKKNALSIEFTPSKKLKAALKALNPVNTTPLVLTKITKSIQTEPYELHDAICTSGERTFMYTEHAYSSILWPLAKAYGSRMTRARNFLAANILKAMHSKAWFALLEIFRLDYIG